MVRSILMFLCFVCFYGTAFAEPAVFGPKECQYSIDVPEGWDKSVTGSSILVTSSDKENSLAVTIFDDKKVTIKSLQQILPSKLGLTDVVKQEKKQDVFITGTCEGVSLQVTLRSTAEGIITTIAAGNEKDILKKCISSLHVVSKKEGNKKHE